MMQSLTADEKRTVTVKTRHRLFALSQIALKNTLRSKTFRKVFYHWIFNLFVSESSACGRVSVD